MTEKNLQLEEIFRSVTQTLAENQANLDQADTYNHDHGSNMVQTFQTITKALQKKKTASDSTALRYAAQQLSKQTTSGSGKLYAENLTQAANQFKGRQVDSRGALDLLQTLIGGGQPADSTGQAGGDLLGTFLGMAGSGGLSGQQTPPSSGGDMLGALLGSLTSGDQASTQQDAPGRDLLGNLLGSLMGGGSSSSSGSNKPGAGNLLNAALAFFQAKQSGGNTMQALIQAFMAANRMGGTSHRSQSTQVVVETFLKALQG